MHATDLPSGTLSTRADSAIGIPGRCVVSRCVAGVMAGWPGPLPAGGLAGRGRMRSAPGGDFGEAGQAPAGADGIAHLLPALAVAVKVAVGEHHPGAGGLLGAEG